MSSNSTIIVKKKQLSCGHFGFNFSKGRCKSCATLASFNSRQEKDIDKDGLQDLISDLDAVFSTYIRMNSSDANGEAVCYTCGHKTRWQQLHNGHFISRGCLYLRFDPRNCRPQCENCNCFKNGNLTEYAKRLEIENSGITEILKEESRMIYKYTTSELKELISEYSKKIK